jgi:Zn-finger nucleic acid-binding protein
MNGHCPVCVEAQLNPQIRSGVEIDVCPCCRGIGLERGELENLVARVNQELGQYRSRGSAGRPPVAAATPSNDHTVSEASWGRSATSSTERICTDCAENPR